jgi:hypothetical protein
MWEDPFPPGNGDPAQSLITNMWQFAKDHPAKFYTPPDACQPNDPNLADCQANARGYRALSGAISNLAGVPLDGVISVNLSGLPRPGRRRRRHLDERSGSGVRRELPGGRRRHHEPPRHRHSGWLPLVQRHLLPLPTPALATRTVTTSA